MKPFEHDLECYVQSYKASKKQVEKDGPLLSTGHIGLRIMEPEQFEPVVASLRECTEPEARKWIEDLHGLTHGRLDGYYIDHQVEFFERKALGSIGNVIVNAFDLDHEDLGITFKILGYGVSKALHGELCIRVGERVIAKIKRAGHWQEQEGLPGVPGEEE